MANTFKLKRSSVQNRVPATSDLDLGELAWNSYDGKLYGKKDDGTAAIVEIGASSGGGATDLSYNGSTRLLSSSTGSDVTLPEVTGDQSGLMTAAQKTKLDSIQSNAKNFSLLAGTNAASTDNGNGTIHVNNSVSGGSMTGTVYFNPPDLSVYYKSGSTATLGSLVVDGTIDSGATDYAGYRSDGTNIVLKGDASGRSGIFFQSEKNGTNINHPTDYGYIQFHPYGIDGSSGEANRLVIGVANDSTDRLVLQSPYKNGVKISFKDATSGTGGSEYTVWHAGNDGVSSGLHADLLDGQHGSYYLNYNNFTNTPTIPSPLTTEQVQDIVGGMVTGNTEENITVTYDDTTGKLDFGVNDGSSSGLDADLLDGQHGSYYLDYNNFTNTPTIPSSDSFIDTSNTEQYKSGRLSLGTTDGTNEGLSIRHIASTGGYGSIRGYDGTTNNSTIHFFSNSWTGGNGATSGVTGSQGCINLAGSYGVTFGDWNNPDAYVQFNILGIRGDNNGTKGMLKLGNADNTYALTLAPSSSIASNFTITLPADTGSNGQVLTTDGSGITSWTTVSGGSGGISNVHEDTTPSLGGNLDVDGYSIYFADSNGTNNLIALGEASDFKIYHDPNSNYIDCSQKLIIKTSGNGVELQGDGTPDGSAGQIRLNCSANSHGIWLSAPLHSDFTSSYTFSLPPNAGSNGQVLTTDGTGYTTWTTVSGGGGGIGSVVEDTTPQLGGVLDLNNQFIYSNASGLGSTYGDVSIVPIQTVYGSLDGGLKILCRDRTSGSVHSQYYFNGPDLSTPGSITASGNVTAYSDVKLKKDIKPIEDALDKISQIRGVTFQRNDLKTDVRFAGVIAQELEQVLPEVVSTDELGIKSVAYGNLVSLLIEAVKEQQAEINELKAHIYDQGK